MNNNISSDAGLNSPRSADQDRAALQLGAWLWVLVFAYGIHVMEEHAFNWAVWINGKGMAFNWTDFYLANAAVMLLGGCAASVGFRLPVFGLAVAGLMTVNGLIFHLLPSLLALRPNPGMLTALFLFLPLTIHVFRSALQQGLTTRRQILGAIGFGAAINAVPLVLLKLQPLLSY